MNTEQDLTAAEGVSAQELASPIAPARCSGVCQAHGVHSSPYGWRGTKNIKELMRSFGFFLSKTICTILAIAQREFWR